MHLLTFDPGVIELEVGVVILEDSIVEEDEEFLVVLSVPVGEEGVEVREETATITIVDNDGELLSSVCLSVCLSDCL